MTDNDNTDVNIIQLAPAHTFFKAPAYGAHGVKCCYSRYYSNKEKYPRVMHINVVRV